MNGWLTCTPRDFVGHEGFFSRDTGLLCRGFQSAGSNCRVVMTGIARSDDLPDVVRAPIQDLEKPEWWRRQEAEGVVLYAWGRPRYLGVARAIRRAGIFLVLNQDSAGLVSPLAYPREWLSGQFLGSGAGKDFSALATFAWRAVRGLSAGLLLTDPLRALHLRQGDIIGAVSPVAADRYRRLCRIYGGERLAEKVRLIPHPVSTDFHFGVGEPAKDDLVISVGRWDDENQKRPGVLATAITTAMRERKDTRFEIFGPLGQTLPAWHAALAPDDRARVRLAGPSAPRSLAAAMRRARVFLSSSAYEGGQIAAMEALCSGCGFVGCAGAPLACNHWFAEAHPEALAAHPDALAECLLKELAAWDQGQRDPVATSRTWGERVYAPAVARSILNLAKEFQSHDPS